VSVPGCGALYTDVSEFREPSPTEASACVIRLNGCSVGIVKEDTHRAVGAHMIESEEIQAGETPEDPVVAALTKLSDVATSSADDLMGLNEHLDEIRSRRVRGWSWHRIISDGEVPNPLSLLTTIAANFARASGAFRRALAVGLRKEGMQVTEIASLFGVSRQRVSALIRPRPKDEVEEVVD